MAFENLKSTGIKYVLTKLKDYFVQIKDSVRSVNGNTPDGNGDITLNTVPYSQNLESESSQRKYGTFFQRMSGGDGSVSDGDAWLMVLKGNSEHTGYSPESIEMTVTSTADPEITAELDRDTFVSYVLDSGTITLTYTTAWSADPALYGITVTGTPVNGDTIVVVYVKEVRGTITVSFPTSFVATGWNLYSQSWGYAKVCKYAFGYKITGTYSTIKFATTPTGAQSDVVVNDGYFDVPSDGYVIITGGNSTDTAVFAIWEDWTNGYQGSFEPFSESVIDLTAWIGTGTNFPYGLLKAGTAVDELNFNLGYGTSRVERMAYSAENLATAKASGREYEYDENYIYLARATPTIYQLTGTNLGGYQVSDHGIEYFTDSDCPVNAETLYGANLKNKLERDVATLSQQVLSSSQQAQVRSNIGAASAADVSAISSNLTTVESKNIDGTYCYLHKKADVIYMFGHSAGGKTLTGDGQWHTLTTVDAGYRPRGDIYFAGASTGGKGISFHLTQNGTLEYVTDANTSYWNYSVSFLL